MSELLPWHHMPAQDVLLALETKSEGLSAAEAEARLKKYGENALEKPRPLPAGRIFIRQIANPLTLLLGVAVLMSVILGRYSDVALTIVVMLVNAVMGFVQEYRADRALQALKNYLPKTVSVRRERQVRVVPITEIVPGDILLLAAGAHVPADARVLVAKAASVNESTLTGESQEVMKTVHAVGEAAAIGEQTCMVFAGATVVAGRLEAVVVATGRATHFGQVSELVVDNADERTPLQQELSRLSTFLAVMMSVAALAVFGLGAIRGLPLLTLLGTAAALAVAAVPEGLLVSVTVILTVGMRHMVQRHALVRRLVAAETLGGVSVLCVDKTGTLTTGDMAVAELRAGTLSFSLQQPNESGRVFLRELFLASSARVDAERGSALQITGSVTEVSLMRYVWEHRDAFETSSVEIVDELPFDSRKKYSAKVIREAGQERLLVMGAPDALLKDCDLTDLELRTYHEVLANMTSRGLRVLFLAGKARTSSTTFQASEIHDLHPLGLVGLEDPLRPQARETVRLALAAGIRTIMITGDHPATAAAVAAQLGLAATGDALLLGADLDQLSEDQLQSRLRHVSVCARILPEQKLRLVKGLQTLGETVAMTGDGVNDTPALRAADIGVAVGSGTEAAKAASDMVILDNDVHSIVSAVKEGRIIFDNIRKVLTHLLTFSMSEVGLIAGVIALGLPVPFWPLHILWINMVTDGLPSLALAFEPAEVRIMEEPPRRRRTPLLTRPMRSLMLFTGSLAVACLLGVYVVLMRNGLPMETIRTLLFVSLGLDSLFAIFPLRSLRRPFWQVPLFRNPQLLGAVGVGLVLLFLPQMLPGLRAAFGFTLLGVSEWGILFGLTATKILLIEIAKLWFLGDIRKAGTMVTNRSR